MNNRKRMGDRTESCGTPLLIDLESKPSSRLSPDAHIEKNKMTHVEMPQSA